jgi:coenzyme F420 hydrogenase subunit alpha
LRKTVTISPIPLTEGLSKLYLKVEDGIIKEGYYYSLIPVRGYETLLIGKEATSAPILASRICGLCQITHAIASAKAIENACNIEVSEKAEKLREALGLAVRIYNNLLHQIVISEDLFEDNRERLDFIRKIQVVRKIVSKVLESVGGEIIHSPNIRVGGISEPLEEFVREKLIGSLEEITPTLHSVEQTFLTILSEKWEKHNIPETLGSHNLKFFSSDKFYSGKVKIENIKEEYPQIFYKELEIKREASNRIPLIDNEFRETGPRARKVLFDGLKSKGGIKELYKCRSSETLEAMERLKGILKENTFSDKEELWNRSFPFSDGEKLGVGVHEAPRGTNIHTVKIDRRGKISYYKIIVPTAINFPVISEALKGEKVEFAEFIVRAYDPCIVCASH